MSRILFDNFEPAPDIVFGAPSFSFSPAGAIGLPAQDAVVLLRFDEAATAIHAKDSAGTLLDLGASGANTPPVGDGGCGRARVFSPSSSTGLIATDQGAESSLLTRDMTIQAILSLNVAAQNSAGT